MKYILSLIIFLCSCSSPNNSTGYRPTHESIEREKLANMILKKMAAKLKADRGLIPCGSGGGTSNGVRMLALSFDYRKPLTIETGRELLVTSVVEFTKAVNQEVRIRHYLKNYPFEPKNIEVRIFLLNPNGTVIDTGLCVISACRGSLCYNVRPSKDESFITLFEETYEEAVQKINEQHNSHAEI